MKNKRRSSGGLSSLISSLVAIVVGLAFGLIILLISNPTQAFAALGVIIAGGFNGGIRGLGQVLYFATPLIMTGLSVGFAFKTGLFNIGAPGQLMMGSFAAVWVGANLPQLPQPLPWLIPLLCAMLVGGLWGAIPGLFKSLLNVNEVISCIMCNYIGMYTVNYLIKNSNVYNSRANLTIDVTRAAIPKWGLDTVFYEMKGKLLDVSSVNAGIFIAIFLAIIMYVVLNKTTFGYELKACGLNRNASKYAGINESRSVLLSMVIAGALAGIGGGLMYLAPSSGLHMRVEEILSAVGFNGIPVALLGLSNPIGTIFSALFIAHITQGGFYLQKLDYMPEIIDIIIAVIIYFSAFSLVVKNALGFLVKRRQLRQENSRETEAKA